jgi:copper chaperone for superoxide dismutase
VRGLIRMVQVSPNLSLFDITIKGLSPGKYWASIRETGDISQGVITTGGIWRGSKDEKEAKDETSVPRGELGSITVALNGTGSAFTDRPIQVWEMIGRSIVVSKQHQGEGNFEKNDEDTVMGVIARSAGVWDNDKTVCSCSGKTVWEERVDEVKRGML